MLPNIIEQWLILSDSPQWLVLFGFFFDLRNVPIINSVAYQYRNIFFRFHLILFFFNLATTMLILLFGTARNYNNFSSLTPL